MSAHILQGDHDQNAWVVFSGQTDLSWLKIFKPGFRHCFVLLNDGSRWVSFDPLSNHTEISVHHHVPPEFDLPYWMEGRGYSVVETSIERHKKPAPFMPFTCVEAVKRVLGLHKRFIFTPWQLYRFLQGQHSNKGEYSWEV